MTPPPPWAAVFIDWHGPAAYFFAAAFPALRWLRLKLIRQSISLGSVIHQSATGFVLPAFLMLLFSYVQPVLVTHVTPHELGMAGLIAAITSMRELISDGNDDKSNHSGFAS